MTTKKKILFVISNMDRGGAQRVFLNLTNHFCSQDKYEVYLILYKRSNTNNYNSSISNKCNIIYLNSTAKFGWLKLAYYIRVLRPEVIFSTLAYINISAITAHIFSRIQGIKLIVREANTLVKYNNTILLLQRILYRKITYVIAITPEIKRDIQEKLKIKPVKVKLIPNPINIDDINKCINGYKNNTVSNDLVKMIYVGRLLRHKNIPHLIDILSMIKKDKWHLTLVGDGDDRSTIENKIKEYNLSDKVDITGFRNNPFKYMIESDLFLLPSLWEGFPNVIVEAMACKCFVISNNTIGGGAKYIKQITNNIDVVDYDNKKQVKDKIGYYLNNKEELYKKKNSACKSVEKLNISIIGKEYEKLLLQ